jgi:uncharacterized protein
MDAAQQTLEQDGQVRRGDVGAHRAGALGAGEQYVERRVQVLLERAGDGDGVGQVALGGRLLADPAENAEEGRAGVRIGGAGAEDGVLAYPFAPPGQPAELRGRDTIRSYFSALGGARELFVQDGVEAAVWETDDPELVITEITHHGRSNVTGGTYRFSALGFIRVRDGEIVRYDDYMDPIALARLLGRTGELAAALGAGRAG